MNRAGDRHLLESRNRLCCKPCPFSLMLLFHSFLGARISHARKVMAWRKCCYSTKNGTILGKLRKSGQIMAPQAFPWMFQPVLKILITAIIACCNFVALVNVESLFPWHEKVKVGMLHQVNNFERSSELMQNRRLNDLDNCLENNNRSMANTICVPTGTKWRGVLRRRSSWRVSHRQSS